jgi:hypothetical protein
MAINEAGGHFGWGNVMPVVRISAMVLGLIAVGCVAVVAAQHMVSPPKQALDVAAKNLEVTARPAMAGPGSSYATKKARAGDLESGRVDSTRECRPETGVVTECIFN